MKQLLWFLFFSLTTIVIAKDVQLYNTDVISFNKKSFIFEDKNSLDFEEILTDSIQKKFKLNQSETPNFGHTNATIWIKFTAKNNIPDLTEKLYLFITPIWLDSIHFYIPTKDNEYKHVLSGQALPFDTRILKKPHYFFDFPLKMDEEKTFYIAIQSQHIVSFHLHLGGLIGFDYKSQKDDSLFFLYIGMMFLLCSYNIFLAIGTKQKSNIFYGCYIFFLIMSMFYIKGYATNIIDLPWLAVHSNIFVSLMMIFLTFSIVYFTHIKDFSKFLFYSHYLIIFFAIVSLILNLLNFVLLANTIVVNISFLGGLWGLGIAITLIQNKVSLSNIFIFLAFMFFMCGGITHVCMIKGYISVNIFTENVFMLGSGVEVMFLSISFSLSIQKMKKDKYNAQKKLLVVTQEKERLMYTKAIELEELVHNRTLALEERNNELRNTIYKVNFQKRIIENKSKHINDSINYAKNIQNALLPPFSAIRKMLPNFFILYKPKDVLSGDIYWFAEKNGKQIIAAIDCTGHGVPGALMSMTVHGILQQIVFEKNITQPNLILNELHNGIRYTLKQDYTKTNDGLDISLISYDINDKNLEFAGAKNSLIYIQDEKLTEIRGDRVSVGGVEEGKERDYKLHTLTLKKDTHIYLSSDGYQDQFGVNGKKFMKKCFKEKLLEFHNFPLEDQKNKLETTLFDWMQDTEQIDDILVIGLLIHV